MEHQSEKLSTLVSSELIMRRRSSSNSRRGIALVIVLSFLILIAVIVLAFFSSVTTEYSTAKAYSGGVNARFITDSATNLVIGQIAKATKPQAAGSISRLTWASQPGMIRTYDDAGAAGACYKLYSSSAMVIGSSGLNDAMAADVPQGWNTFPANYTDLNSPVTDHTGKLNFPIVDGNLTPLTLNGINVLTYSTDGSTPDIEGFSIPVSSVPTYDSSQAISARNNPAPMPVQWLYVLQDGSITATDAVAAGSATTTATFKNSTNPPTAGNPIVGRIAFWTDDETSKLNINTASEGSYFAYPHTSTATDMYSQTSKKSFGFAVSPPASGEFNRYPGHPATTCLSVALGKWLNPNGYTVPTAYSSAGNDSNFISGPLTQFMSLSPRNALGGSKAGTLDNTSGDIPPGATQIYGNAPGNSYGAIPLDTDRLFASVDELMFTPSMDNSQSPPLRAMLNGQLADTPGTNYRPLERLQFFLTASSRAPEITPFNTPKISLWPQWSTKALRQAAAGTSAPASLKLSTALLAFCSSFGSGSSSPSGSYEYFLQRNSATSWNSSRQDWDNVSRNRDIGTYLYNLGKTPIPGYGGTFVNKYTYGSVSSYPSIVVESLDYIRSTIGRFDYNTVDFTGGNVESFIAPLVVTSTLSGASPSTPLKGFGHYPVCTQVVLGGGLSNLNTGPGSTPTTGSPVAFLGFQFFIPTQANPGNNDGVPISIPNTAGLGIKPLGNNPVLPAKINTYDSTWGYYNNSPLFSWINVKNAPMKAATWVFDWHTKDANGNDVLNAYTYDNTAKDKTFTMGSANTVTFQIKDNDTSASPDRNIVQQITVTFPAQKMPVPTTPTVNGAYGCNFDNSPSAAGWTNQPLMYAFNSLTGSSARGLEVGPTSAVKGDWRLLGTFYTIADNARTGAKYFGQAETEIPTPTTNYADQTKQQVHSLRIFSGGANDSVRYGNYAQSPICINGSGTHPSITSIAGSLTSVLNPLEYEDFSAPCVPKGLLAATNFLNRPGDWDTGPGLMPDGPFIHPMDQNNNAGLTQFYLQDQASHAVGATYSPNRIVASPVAFGSLPTGSNPTSPQPWQTLLFCPNPAARSVPSTNLGITSSDRAALAGEHVGFKTPPDHVYLEFFTMPTVQPYAISEPLSTAGKVNLNYQLAPFTNIERSTALRGVFKNTLISAISGNDVAIASQSDHPTAQGNGANTSKRRYKFESDGSNGPVIYPNETHYDINRDATLAGIEKYFFNNGNIFRYPSEICSVFLVPTRLTGATYAGQTPPTTYDQMTSWWNGGTKSTMDLTGDNLREEPYDHIYPRVTTKSNSYTVHYRVQTLKKKFNPNPAQAQANGVVWEEGQDIVTAEFRGSSLIERYIDPNDPQLNSSWDADTISVNLNGKADLSHLYKFRVISTKKFAP